MNGRIASVMPKLFRRAIGATRLVDIHKLKGGSPARDRETVINHAAAILLNSIHPARSF